MTFSVATQRDLGPAIDADKQDGVVGKAASQVEEQADRAAIRPLEIVDNQQQGLSAGQDFQNPRVLRKESFLVSVTGDPFCLLPADKLVEPAEQGLILHRNVRRRPPRAGRRPPERNPQDPVRPQAKPARCAGLRARGVPHRSGSWSPHSSGA